MLHIRKLSLSLSVFVFFCFFVKSEMFVSKCRNLHSHKQGSAFGDIWLDLLHRGLMKHTDKLWWSVRFTENLGWFHKKGQGAQTSQGLAEFVLVFMTATSQIQGGTECNVRMNIQMCAPDNNLTVHHFNIFLPPSAKTTFNTAYLAWNTVLNGKFKAVIYLHPALGEQAVN